MRASACVRPLCPPLGAGGAGRRLPEKTERWPAPAMAGVRVWYGTRGQNRCVFDANRLVGTATKNKPKLSVLGSKMFLSVGARTDKTGPQPTQFGPPNRPFVLTDNRLGVPPTQLPTAAYRSVKLGYNPWYHPGSQFSGAVFSGAVFGGAVFRAPSGAGKFL